MGRRTRALIRGLLVVLLAALVLAPGYFIDWRIYPAGWRLLLGPRTRPLTNRKFERNPVRLERGEYLVNSVLVCFRCHSDRDWNLLGAPALAGKSGAGHEYLNDGTNSPGVVAPNITPDSETGAGQWTDDMLARAIREGIGHDGRALFPAMLYASFRSLSDEDLASVIVYLRSLPAVHNPLPKTHLSLVNRMAAAYSPEPLTSPVPSPDFQSPVKRGEYLARIADCVGCHTDWYHPGSAVDQKHFAGGNSLPSPRGRVYSANITPDASGIGYYNAELFIKTIRTGNVGARELNPVMPWYWYRNMSEGDLRAVFDWLRVQPPVKHLVDNTESPTYCRLCRQYHGGGDRN
jgi:mono/diheme cytochrome c family protein